MGVSARELIETIDAELVPHADPEFRARVRDRYRVDVDRFLGVRTPVIRRVAGEQYSTIKAEGVDLKLRLCEGLLETRLYEHKVVAFDWAYRCRREHREEHLDVFERWLDTYVDDWMDCDDLCTHALGAFVVDHPRQVSRVKGWTRSSNRWVRRGAAVVFVPGARKGMFLADVFEVADLLAWDRDDLVQKACGWALKESSKAHPGEVFGYVSNRKDRMPRVVLRYAIERLPEDLRREAMRRDEGAAQKTKGR